MMKQNSNDPLGTIPEYKNQNLKLENSPEYKKVIDDVMKDVYTEYANCCMKMAECLILSVFPRHSSVLSWSNNPYRKVHKAVNGRSVISAKQSAAKK